MGRNPVTVLRAERPRRPGRRGDRGPDRAVRLRRRDRPPVGRDHGRVPRRRGGDGRRRVRVEHPRVDRRQGHRRLRRARDHPGAARRATRTACGCRPRSGCGRCWWRRWARWPAWRSSWSTCWSSPRARRLIGRSCPRPVRPASASVTSRSRTPERPAPRCAASRSRSGRAAGRDRRGQRGGQDHPLPVPQRRRAPPAPGRADRGGAGRGRGSGLDDGPRDGAARSRWCSTTRRPSSASRRWPTRWRWASRTSRCRARRCRHGSARRWRPWASPGLEARDPMTLSGGEQQRLAIACAVAMRPSVLVMDEPTANLDPAGSAAVFEIVRRLCREDGLTVIVATHDVEAHRRARRPDPRARRRGGDPRRGASSTCSRRLARTDGASAGVRVPEVTAFAALLDAGPRTAGSALPVTVDEALAWLAAPPMTADRPAVLALRDVSFRYAAGAPWAVDGCRSTCRPGLVVGIAGANGSGKSTLGEAHAGPASPGVGHRHGRRPGHRADAGPPARGARRLRRAEPESPAVRVDRRRRAGVRSAQPGPAGRRGRGPRRRRRRGVWASRTCSTATRITSAAARRKLVTIASVLAMRTPVLVLDEPTTAQDHRTSDVVGRLIRELRDARDGRRVRLPRRAAARRRRRPARRPRRRPRDRRRRASRRVRRRGRDAQGRAPAAAGDAARAPARRPGTAMGGPVHRRGRRGGARGHGSTSPSRNPPRPGR